MRDELFKFRSKHSTALELTSLFERMTSKFGEKRLTDAVFLEVEKTSILFGLMVSFTS
jgi:hypothetical protein